MTADPQNPAPEPNLSGAHNDPQPRYILLNPGDVIQEGDEYYIGKRVLANSPAFIGLVVSELAAPIRRGVDLGHHGHEYMPSLDPMDQGDCAICGNSQTSHKTPYARHDPAAPYQTDLMVSPETIDAFMVANPMVEDTQDAIEQALQTCDAWSEDFFSPISKEELGKAVDAVSASGISSARLHASWARHVVGLLRPALTESAALFVQLRDDLAATQRDLAEARQEASSLRAANDKLAAQVGRMREAIQRARNYIHMGMFDRSGPVIRQIDAAIAPDADHD